MSLNPITALCVAKLFPQVCAASAKYDCPLTVLDLGTQRLRCSKAFPQIRELPGIKHPHDLEKCKTAKEFYEAIGFDKYVDVDLEDSKAAVTYDLNKPWDTAQRYDLVVNSGTGEHVFDQANVFRSVHNVCCVGGHMLHILPGPYGWLNHGFWAMQPRLFKDLATANGYDIVMLYFGRRSGELWYANGRRNAVAEALEAAADAKGPVFLVAALRKMSSARFVVPYDSRYFSDAKEPA